MAALAKDRNTRTRGVGQRGVGDVAAATKIYKGALIAKNAAGYIVPASDTAALVVIGVAEAQVDNTAGGNGALTVPYVTGLCVELNNAGGAIVQASKHLTCYVADDNSVTTAAVAANDIKVGQVREFTTALVWVYVDEFLAIS